MKIMITGVAGFIGAALARCLLKRGDRIVGVDNINDYYDPALKQARLARLCYPGFEFCKIDVTDREALYRIFSAHKPRCVIHLAAHVGVRHSIKNPDEYVHTNITGFMNILEACRHHSIDHLAYASSSSVYGASTKIPHSVHHVADHPLSMYAVSKKTNELMAHCYSHLYELPATGLRFFTVYGPWGRPDMALFSFTRKILADEPIEVFNYGKHRRDFTYIDDIVEGVMRVLDRPPQPNPQWDSDNPDPASSSAPHRVYNIGNNRWVELSRYIAVLEECLGKKAHQNLLPKQIGEMVDTYADVQSLVQDFDYQPKTPLEQGVAKFVQWYLSYYGVRK